MSLPSQELMEHAKHVWEDELHLPELTPREPWLDTNSVLARPLGPRVPTAVDGEYLDTGKEYESLRTRSSYFDDRVVRQP